MKIICSLAFLALGVSLLSPTQAQQTTTAKPVLRDSRAEATVQRAIVLLGGAQRMQQVADVTVEGQLTSPDGGPVQSGSFLWQNAGDEYRYEYPTVEGTAVCVSNHGRPATQNGQNVFQLRGHPNENDFPVHLPGMVLLQEFNNPQYSFILLDSPENDASTIRIQAVLETNDLTRLVTRRIWSFDAQTGVPVSVEYSWLSRADVKHIPKDVALFADYRDTNGLLLPYRISVQEDDDTVATFQANRISLNSGIQSSVFEAPLGEKQ